LRCKGEECSSVLKEASSGLGRTQDPHSVLEVLGSKDKIEVEVEVELQVEVEVECRRVKRRYFRMMIHVKVKKSV
jgi:hypothetical protein